MYAVVGCTDCGSLWVLETGSETATCPRCGGRHPTDQLRHFAESQEADAARDARSAIVADRRGAGETAPSFGDLEASIDGDAVEDAARLEAAGVDPGAVAEAGERAASGAGSGTSRREIVLSAFEELGEPTRQELRAYATERGVPADAADRLLRKLVRSGRVTETDGRYRKL